MKKILSMIVVIVIFATISIVPISAADKKVVNVSNVDELLAAIKSDTRIVLAPGKYIIPMDNYKYEKPTNVLIDGLSNITIEGNSKAEIATESGGCPVIEIRNSTDIKVKGVTLGHTAPSYGCDYAGYVIRLDNASNITISNSDLYGCGVMGIYAMSSGNVTVNNSIIRDCMVGAVEFMYLNGDVTFNKCQFLRNAYDVGDSQSHSFANFVKMDPANTGMVTFDSCNFEDNLNTYFLRTKIQWSECPESDLVVLKNCTFKNNLWETAIHVKSSTNGKYWTEHRFSDQLPIIVEGRTLIPVRGVFEKLGYSIEWDQEAKTAYITDKDKSVKVAITIGSHKIVKTYYDENGEIDEEESINIDVPASIINDRTMVPLRAIADAFGYDVEWENETRSVLIYAFDEAE